MRHVNACAQLAGVADDLGHLAPRRLLVELAHTVAGIPRSGPAVWLVLLAGGRTRLPGGGFRPELRDHTAGQTRHFAGTARAVTVLGADRTRWLSVHVRRDSLEAPDGRLSELAIAFATGAAGRRAAARRGRRLGSARTSATARLADRGRGPLSRLLTSTPGWTRPVRAAHRRLHDTGLVPGGVMRIALLSYRSKPHCGGQGIYVRHLSRELVALGHTVEVFSGQPYPDLDPGVTLTKVPSLDLYREPDPFRVPRLREFRDRVDVEEFLTMCTGGLPGAQDVQHPRRAAAGASARDDFDVVHDNQVLGYGMLDIEAMGLPLVTTIHHPITFDRRIDLEQADDLAPAAHAAPVVRLPADAGQGRPPGADVLTPSEASRRDIATDFGVDPARMRVILLGVDDGFVPPTEPRVPGRILAMASADAPMKGIATLLEAFAKLRTERDVELVLVTKPVAGRAHRAADRHASRSGTRSASCTASATPSWSR